MAEENPSPKPEDSEPLLKSTEITFTQKDGYILMEGGLCLMSGEPLSAVDPKDILKGDDLEKYLIDEAFDIFSLICEDEFNLFKKNRDWLKLAKTLWNYTRTYYGSNSYKTVKTSREVQKYYEFHQEQANGMLSFYLNDAIYGVFDKLHDDSPEYFKSLQHLLEDKHAVVNATSLGQSPLLYMYGLFITILKHWPDKHEDWHVQQKTKTINLPREMSIGETEAEDAAAGSNDTKKEPYKAHAFGFILAHIKELKGFKGTQEAYIQYLYRQWKSQWIEENGSSSSAETITPESIISLRQSTFRNYFFDVKSEPKKAKALVRRGS